MNLMTFFRRLFRREVRSNWHVTHASADTNFNLYGVTYSEAVAELRHRYPNAVLVQIDHEWSVIIFKG